MAGADGRLRRAGRGVLEKESVFDFLYKDILWEQ